MTRYILAFSSFMTSVSLGGVAQNGSEQLPKVGSPTEEILNRALEFLYTIAHWIGQSVVDVLQQILPSMTVPPSLIDAIGFLALVTVFLLLMKVAERIAWVVVSVGWILIVVRLVMIATDTSL